jgi:hypothetical protein
MRNKQFLISAFLYFLLQNSSIFVKATNRTKSEENGNSTINKINSREENEEENFRRAKEERLKQQNDARRRRKQKEREREGSISAQSIISAGENENCDWKTQPLSLFKGEMCGAYYKVLGLDRKKATLVDKSEIKKAYRKKSLAVHPDKNPSPDASAAFKVVQDAYECLSDDIKRTEYEGQLAYEEQRISQHRQILRDRVVAKTAELLYRLNYYATLAAKYIHQTAMDIWDVAGEWEVKILDEERPVGQYLLMFALLMRGHSIIALYSFSYAILRVNHELAKLGVWDQFHGF